MTRPDLPIRSKMRFASDKSVDSNSLFASFRKWKWRKLKAIADGSPAGSEQDAGPRSGWRTGPRRGWGKGCSPEGTELSTAVTPEGKAISRDEIQLSLGVDLRFESQPASLRALTVPIRNQAFQLVMFNKFQHANKAGIKVWDFISNPTSGIGCNLNG